jgi:hypothetical protein
MTRHEPIATVSVDNASEFLEALSIHAEPFITDADAGWLFRGHDDDECYSLVPTVLRGDMLDQCLMMAGRGSHGEHFQELEVFQVWLELRLLRRFLDRADECGLVVPEMGVTVWERINTYATLVDRMIEAVLEDQPNRMASAVRELEAAFDDPTQANWPHPHMYRQLALARHHGLPTRFLDWSRSPRIAAYFAAVAASKQDEVADKWISVWGISKYARGPWSENGDSHSGIESISVPNAGNVNLFYQWGQFTCARVAPGRFSRPIDRRPVDELVKQQADRAARGAPAQSVPLMYRIRAPRSEAMEVLWRLSREGIMKHRMFPEFGSVVDSLREDWFHWRPKATRPRGAPECTRPS